MAFEWVGDALNPDKYILQDVGFYEGMPLSVDKTDPVNPLLLVANVIQFVEVDDPRVDVVEVRRQDFKKFPIRDINSILLASRRPHQ